jgi:protein phosphatase
MKLRVGVASDIGRARERNEDAFLASHPLYAVADGMGGHRGGAVASSLAVDVLSHDDSAPLSERVREANRAVFDRQAGDRAVAGMGTTVTAIEAEEASVRVAHVGDSRAYLLRDGRLRMLTQDHTLVQQMVHEGKITEEEAHDHPQRNILTRVVGVDRDVDVDEESLEVREGDRLLLCTDGLTSMMRDESVQEILEGHADPKEAADSLVDAANRAGGLDNITVVVIDVEPGDGVEILGEGVGPALEGVAGTTDDAQPSTAIRAARDEAPTSARRRGARWRRALIWVGIALVVIAAGLTAFRIYLDRQWYVGVENGHVAVFRGLPSEILGFGLSGLVSETGIPAKDAERFAPYRQLGQGLTRDSKQAAYGLVAEIRHTIRAQQRQQRRHHRKRAGG